MRAALSITVALLCLWREEVMSQEPPIPVEARVTQVQEGALKAGWERRLDRLHVSLQAPTRGWILVGFNDQPGLQGARLLFLWVSEGRAFGEIHRTDLERYPAPYHKPRVAIGGTSDVADLRGVEGDAGTLISASIPLDSGEAQDIALRPGQRLHVILAWSHSDDLNHHSAFRVGRDMIVVPAAPAAQP